MCVCLETEGFIWLRSNKRANTSTHTYTYTILNSAKCAEAHISNSFDIMQYTINHKIFIKKMYLNFLQSTFFSHSLCLHAGFSFAKTGYLRYVAHTFLLFAVFKWTHKKGKTELRNIDIYICIRIAICTALARVKESNKQTDNFFQIETKQSGSNSSSGGCTYTCRLLFRYIDLNEYAINCNILYRVNGK